MLSSERGYGGCQINIHGNLVADRTRGSLLGFPQMNDAGISVGGFRA